MGRTRIEIELDQLESNVDINEKVGKKCKVCNTILQIIPRQTRCADEGSTYFYICNKCEKSRKI